MYGSTQDVMKSKWWSSDDVKDVMKSKKNVMKIAIHIRLNFFQKNFIPGNKNGNNFAQNIATIMHNFDMNPVKKDSYC